MASIILPPGSAPANPSEGELYYDNTAKQVKFRDNAGFKALGTADLQGEPHIITKKLFPAYLGKLLDDTTSHSGDYGTEQSDGRMYYYTDIAGSKPIHDPRIGIHFGSQRHKFKSLQLLEHETATHGKDVHSIDGREWARVCGTTFIVSYTSEGNRIYSPGVNGTDFFEIVGYFSHINLLHSTHSARPDNNDVIIDGSDVGANHSQQTTVPNPLGSRYVDDSSISSVSLGSTALGIHTLKYIPATTGSSDCNIFGIELISQDTTSSSTKVQIQVPAQDVVSYGRKFSVSATAQHYDPFNGFSSGDATALEAKVNTATSLGLAKWLHSGTYYRPYNGMRVVKWIDENGAIKTSVTCMPPNAKSFADSSTLSNANAKANASVANDTFYPTFEAHTTSVIEDNLHEECRTFMTEEFGNGAANGGTNSANWPDASMLSGSSDDIAFCMDDGLTTLVANAVTRASRTTSMPGYINIGSGDSVYTTFIGTGVTLGVTNWAGDAALKHHVAFNLPYGTHILKVTNSSDTVKYIIDGIEVQSAYQTYWAPYEYSIFQPKRPPIPDSACVLADYMVFADFKPQTTAGTQLISKGVRRQNISRDVFFDETDGDSFSFGMTTDSEGFRIDLSGNADSDTSMKMRIPSFGTNYVHRGYQSDARAKLFIGDTDNDSNATKDNTAGYGSYAHLTSDLTLGVHQFGANATSGTNGYTSGFDIVTPIHTSHHYQSFETPFLHELIGGDRSMEQTNLICTSDGKSWDQITRDTSYLGAEICRANTDAGFTGSTSTVIFSIFRGLDHNNPMVNKNFAIAYDRMICLRDGVYEIYASTIKSINTTYHCNIKINGTRRKQGHSTNINHDTITNILTTPLKKGDYVQIEGGWQSGSDYSHFHIVRLGI